MKKILFSLLLIAVFLVGCPTGTDNNGTTSGKMPGKFSATVLSDSMGSRSAARGVSLGDYTVSNSKSIYFILRNVGDFPITNVSLTAGKLLEEGGTFVPITDNGVTASPGSIAVLETSGNTSIETIIEIAINHGNIVGLISQQYIQKADFTGTTIRITGNTVNSEGATVNISLDIDIGALIKVASFELQYITNGTTWIKANYDTRGHYIIPTGTSLKILNTGNVPLKYKAGLVEAGTGGSWELSNVWKDLAIGQYSEDLISSKEYKFIVDTLGVAFNNDGIDDFVFRSNTSILVASTSNGTCISWTHPY
jgi:hypothetical protein